MRVRGFKGERHEGQPKKQNENLAQWHDVGTDLINSTEEAKQKRKESVVKTKMELLL